VANDAEVANEANEAEATVQSAACAELLTNPSASSLVFTPEVK
jgi:hypothetical protein